MQCNVLNILRPEYETYLIKSYIICCIPRGLKCMLVNFNEKTI